VTAKKMCPQCGAAVYSLLTDLRSNSRYCWHCAPEEHKNHREVLVTKKMDLLGLEAYSLEERIQDLNGDKPIWMPTKAN